MYCNPTRAIIAFYGLARVVRLWYNALCHTGDDGWVLCGVMP